MPEDTKDHRQVTSLVSDKKETLSIPPLWRRGSGLNRRHEFSVQPTNTKVDASKQKLRFGHD